MFLTDPSLDAVARGFILTALVLLWILVLVRSNGLRSFSKMTNFDFVTTIAVGSLLSSAGQATDWLGFLQILVAIAALFLLQYCIALSRIRSTAFESVIQNEPVLLMRNGEILHSSLAKTRVAKDDLIAKLRESNVLDFNAVRAVVLETTGDISVLHGEALSEQLLSGVRSPARA